MSEEKPVEKTRLAADFEAILDSLSEEERKENKGLLQATKKLLKLLSGPFRKETL